MFLVLGKLTQIFGLQNPHSLFGLEGIFVVLSGRIKMDCEFLKECFDYNNGELYWRIRPRHHFRTTHGMNIFNSQKAGRRADCRTVNGYLRVRLGHKILPSHRVIYQMFNGHCPEYIDHINCKRDDNRIENLRGVSKSQNNQNRQKTRGKSKYKGVSFHSQVGKWMVHCKDATLLKQENGKSRQRYLGLFDNEISAALCYDSFAEREFGEFVWLNRSNFEEVKHQYERTLEK